jgi:stress-induced morphogen
MKRCATDTLIFVENGVPFFSLLCFRNERCLSGNTAKAIQKVDPEFIKAARIDQSLTPGRNNGFLNMLQTMKTKALEIDEAARNGTTSASESEENDESPSGDGTVDDDDVVHGEGPKFTAIVEALHALKPESLTVTDNSQLNGAAEGEETHFELSIVASAFEGLNVIKRQQLVFMMLGDVMPQIEGLQIASMFTPEEAEKQS